MASSQKGGWGGLKGKSLLLFNKVIHKYRLNRYGVFNQINSKGGYKAWSTASNCSLDRSRGKN